MEEDERERLRFCLGDWLCATNISRLARLKNAFDKVCIRTCTRGEKEKTTIPSLAFLERGRRRKNVS